MAKLIVNADDFGYSEGVNHGIISAHKNGIVTSCTVMANMPGFEHGMDLIKENPTLRCGVHMTLTCYKPLLKDHKTIVDENGDFFRRPSEEVLKNIDLEEVYREFKAQIEKVRERVEITHLDSHHHVHGQEYLRPVIERIASEYKLPMRQSSELSIDGVRYAKCLGNFYMDNVKEEYFEEHLAELNENEVTDLMCHPAFVDEFLLGASSYNVQRAKEHKILTSQKVKKFLEDNGFELVNYSYFNK